MLPVYAERYITKNNRSFLEDMGPYLTEMTFDEAMRFYKALAEDGERGLVEPETEAALGLLDRYYLLTVLLDVKIMLQQPKKGRRWLYDRCREVEKAPYGYLDLWAREHFKSTIITFGGGIQEVLRDPEITIGIFAGVGKVAKPFLAQIMREFESNEVLKGRYPDVLWANPKREAPKWSLQDGIIVKRKENPKECTVEAHGLVDGMPTGRHYKRRFYDDVITRESVTSEDMIRKVTEARELSDNLGGGDNLECNVGTRYHFADTYGVQIERGMLIPRIHAATDNGKKDGNPVFFSPEKWEQKKINQPSQIAAQMLQNPAAGEESTFDIKWLQNRVYEIRPATLNIYIMGDPSKGRSARNDRTALAVIGVDAHLNKYLLDGYRHRMNLAERWTLLKGLHKHWSAQRGVQMVSVGYESYGLQTDQEYFEQQMQVEKYPFGIEELSWTRDGAQSKNDRIERLTPDLKKGSFFLSGLVWHETHGISTWKPDVEKSQISYTPLKGVTKNQQRVVADGQPYRLAKPIKRIDEQKNVYDLTRDFIEEFLFHPFGSHDDLLDAVSRIYDMDPTAPQIIDEGALEPDEYVDGS